MEGTGLFEKITVFEPGGTGNGGFRRMWRERRKKNRMEKRRRKAERQAAERVARYGRETAERMCFRKVPYASKEKAIAAAKGWESMTGEKRFGYPCPICRHWHLTRNATQW